MTIMDHGEIGLVTDNLHTINDGCSLIKRCSSPNNSITKFIDLPKDAMREVFDYLNIGDIYYSFYHINQSFRNFIDKSYTSISLISMSCRNFLYYYENILFNNIEHSQKISSLILTNENSFNQIEKFFHIIHFYSNLTNLCLYSPKQDQLMVLSNILPNLSKLHIILQNEKLTNIKWISSLQKLQICSINSKQFGIEFDASVRYLSLLLECLSITISSTYDFYTLLRLLPNESLYQLNICLYDNEFSYIKTFRSPISQATKLTEFSFDMSLKPMRTPSCLYDIIRFVSTTLRHLKTLTLICRFIDGIFIDEDQLRNYLSRIYSVEKYKLFIQMNNLFPPASDQPSFDEKAYAYSFWTDKGVHLNIYRDENKHIKHVRIYTLPIVSNVVNPPNYFPDTYSFIKSSLNIHEYQSNTSFDSIEYLSNDRTVTPNRIYSTSDVKSLFYLPRVSSLIVTNDDMYSFLNILSRKIPYSTIRKLHLHHFPLILKQNYHQIFQIFPCLRSLSISKIDEFDLFKNILELFLVVLPNERTLIHLRLCGLYFNEICPKDINEEQLKIYIENIFIPLYERKHSYTIAFDRENQFIEFWI